MELDTKRLEWLFANPKNFATITDKDWSEFRETTEQGYNTKSSVDWFREIIDSAMPSVEEWDY